MNRTINTSKSASKQFTFSMPDHIDTDPDDLYRKQDQTVNTIFKEILM